MNGLLKNWKVALSIAVLVLGLVYFIYAQGKKAATGPQIDLPNGTQGIPKGWRPDVLAKQLHDVMDGWFTLAATKEDAFRQLYELPTDDMVVSVYNTFGQLYFSEGNGTLTDWIRDEDNTVLTMFGGVKDQLLGRLQALNLP